MATVLPPQIFVAKVAALYSTGLGLQKIADMIRSETGNGDSTTHRDVSKAIASDEFKEHMTRLTESMLQQAKTQLRSSVARLVPKILSTLEHNLDRNNLNAIQPALKVLGFESVEGEQKDTVLNIVLPGSQERSVDAVQDSGDPNTIQLVDSKQSKT